MSNVAENTQTRAPVYAPEDVVRAKPLRGLTEKEIAEMEAVRTAGQTFLDAISCFGQSRELSLAKTKIEEAVMWAVKHVTR